MRPDEINRIEAEWMSKLEKLVADAHDQTAREMSDAGHSPDEIQQAFKSQIPDLDGWLAARRKDIRSLIISGRYGLIPVLADGTLPIPLSNDQGK